MADMHSISAIHQAELYFSGLTFRSSRCMLCIAKYTAGRSKMTGHSHANEAFLAALVNRFSQAPTVALNPHCISERALYSLFDEIDAEGVHIPPTKHRAVAWLKEIGLLTPIAVEPSSNISKRSTRFYRLDVSKRAKPQTSPFELLQAYDRAGVICFFSAIAFHKLSTQPPTHHHLAICTEPKQFGASARQRKKTAAPPDRKIRDPLGTWLFSYDGVRYYKTSREAGLVPGVQARFIGPTALIRITSLEQTLLDTLHRPLSCGGPSVVMEAWEQALSRLNEDKLELYLNKMDRLPIAQRLGYILGNLAYQPGKSLKSALEGFRLRLNPDDPSAYQQLFPGVKYGHLERKWLIYGPA